MFGGSLLVRNKKTGLFPLDLISGAWGGFSLRRLSSTYTDSVVTVRKESDNSELAFTANQIADGTLVDWCNGSNAYIKTWHNQTGGLNVTQSDISRQPIIVTQGSLLLENGKPLLLFSGTSFFSTPSGAGLTNDQGFAFLSVFKRQSSSVVEVLSANRIVPGIAGRYQCILLSDASLEARVMSNASTFIGAKTPTNSAGINQILLGYNYKNAGLSILDSQKIIINGTTQTLSATASGLFTPSNIPSSEVLNIGSQNNTGNIFSGLIQEVLIFDRSIDQEIDLLSNNINNYYSIY